MGFDSIEYELKGKKNIENKVIKRRVVI